MSIFKPVAWKAPRPKIDAAYESYAHRWSRWPLPPFKHYLGKPSHPMRFPRNNRIHGPEESIDTILSVLRNPTGHQVYTPERTSGLARSNTKSVVAGFDEFTYFTQILANLPAVPFVLDTGVIWFQSIEVVRAYVSALETDSETLAFHPPLRGNIKEIAIQRFARKTQL